MAARYIYSIAFSMAAVGFLWPFWPLCVIGIIFAALMGRWMFAIAVGLLLDIAWGAPTGLAEYVYVPFTLLAVALSAGRYFFADYFLSRRPTDTL